MEDIAGLKKNVGFLNWIAAAGVGAIVALYFVLSGQIDSRFNKADEKISDLRVAIASQAGDVKLILDKVDDRKPPISAKTKPAK